MIVENKYNVKLSEISIIPCEIAIKEWMHICKEEISKEYNT